MPASALPILTATAVRRGVAVAIEGGLFTPVIRQAEMKTLSEISNEMKDLADRARKRVGGEDIAANTRTFFPSIAVDSSDNIAVGKLAGFNLLLSDDITPESRLMFERQIRRRVAKIAPFLVLDEDPYPVVSDGRIFWIQDAYTVSDRYPYASAAGSVNYIRNSVKVVIDAATKQKIFFAALVIFVYRATPSVGQGYTWFTIDVLGFEETFQGTLAQIATGLALVGTWLFSDAITRQPAARVLLWLTIATSILALPSLGLTLGLHTWTERNFGFGAHTIAILDAAATSPFAQLSMIPLLTLCAVYAPAGRRASWFALMASLMNLALVAGGLLTKYLNQAMVVSRGEYANLPMLLGVVVLIGFVVPVAAILLVGRRLR